MNVILIGQGMIGDHVRQLVDEMHGSDIIVVDGRELGEMVASTPPAPLPLMDLQIYNPPILSGREARRKRRKENRKK